MVKDALRKLRKKNNLSQEELAGKRHYFELEKCGSTVVCVDAMMAGVGSNSCGPALAEKYRLPLPNVHLNLTMKI